jgi:short-subunit dehydrogenase
MRKNDWAVVTGASAGIGAEFAGQLASKQISLILIARRLEVLESLKLDLLKKNPEIEILCLQADLTLVEDIDRVYAQAIEKNRKIKILINNAGVGFFKEFKKTHREEYRQMLALNINAVVELTHLFTQHMLEHGERSYVANIGSIVSFFPVSKYSIYSGSKSFIKSFTETLNVEYRGSNIFFTGIYPGPTESEFAVASGQPAVDASRIGVMTAESVVRKGLEALLSQKLQNIPGWTNKLAVLLNYLLSNKVFFIFTSFFLNFKYRKVKPALDHRN